MAGVRVPGVAIALNGGVAPELVWRNQLDGLTFLRRRAALEPALRDIPVIVLSADRHHTDELLDHAFAVLAKPVSLDRLFELVREKCEASGHTH